MEAPKVIIIAGPNGAGKTTFARQFLPGEAQCPAFINADLIAAGISPFNPDAVAVRAGRLMLEEIEEKVKNRKSFALETTLSGRAYVQKVRDWQEAGYRVKLMFLSLPTADLDVARVASRVRQGGHHIPEDVIRRRFSHGIANLKKLYQPLVDGWIHFDNSEEVPVLLEWGERGVARGEGPADPDLASAQNALKRAAQSARVIARQTGTSCFIIRDGEIVDLMRSGE